MRKITFFLIAGLLPIFCFTQTHSWARANPGGGGAFSTIGAGATGIILAGSDLSGAYRSSDGGASWDIIGASKGLTNTHVSGLGFDPTDGNILFIGTEEGIFRSVDGGNSISQSNMNAGYITDIKICASNHQIGYATYHPTYDSNQGKIYKTTDNGISWNPISNNTLPAGLRILKIVSNPSDENILYCLSGEGRFACGPADIFQSTDGGVNWTNISPDNDEVLDIALDKVDPTKLYATTMHASCNAPFYWTDLVGKFYVSTNSGATWQEKANRTGVIWPKSGASGTIRLIDPREPWPWHTDAGTWKSTDFGASWTHTGDVNNWDVGFQNFGTIGDNLFRNYSSSFNGICKTLGEDLSQDRIFWTNSQWTYSSADEGTTFDALHTTPSGQNWTSTGIDNVTMTDLSISPANSSIIFLGYHDIGLWKSTDGGASWHTCNEAAYSGDWAGYGGNTFTVLADPTRSNVVWASMQGSWGETSTLLRSTSTGDVGSWVATNGLGAPTVIIGLSVDQNSSASSRTLFVTADGDVYKSTDDGQNWSLVFNDANNGCRFTAIDPTNSNIIYAGGESGLFKSTDGGSTWTPSGNGEMHGIGPFAPSDWSGVSKIRITNQGHIYVAAFGAGKGLYRSTDDGSTWQKLKIDDYLRSVALVPNHPDLIYTASSSAFTAGGYTPDSKGIEYSTDAGQTWISANDGMAYPFAVCLESTSDATPIIWVGSPGSGFQNAMIPTQILPVDILSPFSARVKNGQVQLQWKTSEEIQNAGFTISRSKDISHWESILSITPKQNKAYTVIDTNPLTGISYYQLSQKDLDGNSHILGTVSVHFRPAEQPTIFPNPTDGILQVSMNQKLGHNIQCSIFNQTGQQLLTQKGAQIDLSHLPKGLYMLSIQTENQLWHQQIVKY